MLALLLAGCTILVQPAAETLRSPEPLLAQVDRWLVGHGLGIDQVSLEGHRLTSDNDILDALALPAAGSMLLFDGGEAAARIMRLAWIERVQIKPLVPNGLHVVVTERTPYAVWERTGDQQTRQLVDSHLVDKMGHVLGPVTARSYPNLPRIRGEGAAAAAADLHATLSLFPAIAQRLTVSERVGLFCKARYHNPGLLARRLWFGRLLH